MPPCMKFIRSWFISIMLKSFSMLIPIMGPNIGGPRKRLHACWTPGFQQPEFKAN